MADCPHCELTLVDGMCEECGYEPPTSAAEAKGYDRPEEVRGER